MAGAAVSPPGASCEYGRQRGAGPAPACAVPVRRNMTDNVPPGTNGTGERENGAAQPPPWFPPAGEPGGDQPPPFEPGPPPPTSGGGQSCTGARPTPARGRRPPA